MSKRTTTKSGRRSRRSRKKKLLTKKRATRKHQGKKGKKRRASKRRKYSRKKKPSTDSQNPRLTTGGSFAAAGVVALVAAYLANSSSRPTAKIEAPAAPRAAAAVSLTPENNQSSSFFQQEELLPFNSEHDEEAVTSPATIATEEAVIADASPAIITWGNINSPFIIFTPENNDDHSSQNTPYNKYLNYLETTEGLQIPDIIYVPENFLTSSERDAAAEGDNLFINESKTINGHTVRIMKVSYCPIFANSDKDPTIQTIMMKLFEGIASSIIGVKDDTLIAIFPLWKNVANDDVHIKVYDIMMNLMCAFEFFQSQTPKFLSVFMVNNVDKQKIMDALSKNREINKDASKNNIVAIYNQNIQKYPILSRTLK